MEQSFFIIDAFTSEPFAGNPAAVVLDADGLSDAQMQSIAAEFNLSETTFVLPPTSSEGDYRFRWFTPTVEVSMCGHATVAGLRALVETGAISHNDSTTSTTVALDTLSGTLQGFVESIPNNTGGLMFWLDLPDPTMTELSSHVDDALARALGLPRDAFVSDLPIVRTQDDDLIVFVADFKALDRKSVV